MSVHSRGWEVCKACCCLEGSSFSKTIPFIGAMHGIFYKHHNHVAVLIARKLGPIKGDMIMLLTYACTRER